MFDLLDVEELGRKLAAVDPDACTPEDKCAAALVLTRLASFAETASAHFLASLDADGTCDAEFGLPAAAWVARETRSDAAVVRSRLQVGRALRRHLPEVDDALISGRVSYSHAKVLAGAVRNPRVTDVIVGLQGELLDDADSMLFPAWRGQARRVVELVDQDGPHDPNADLAKNWLRTSFGLDGRLRIEGEFTKDYAESVRQMLENAADEQFRQYTADHDVAPDVTIPKRSTLTALGFYELLRRGHGVDLESTAGPRVEASYVLPAGAFELSDGTTWRCSCHPDLIAIIVDHLGVPIDMARKVRFATEHQRKAIVVRDGGCVFPGCDKPISWCDIHHVIAWQNGGKTDLVNLAPLCRHHHGVTHRHRWTMRSTEDHWFWWQTPTGHTFWSQRHQRLRQDEPPSPVPRN